MKAKLGFQNFYVYSAVNPKSGEDCTIFAPYVNTASLNVFLQEMARGLQEREVLLIMDQAGWHKATELVVPTNIKIAYLPLKAAEYVEVQQC